MPSVPAPLGLPPVQDTLKVISGSALGDISPVEYGAVDRQARLTYGH